VRFRRLFDLAKNKSISVAAVCGLGWVGLGGGRGCLVVAVSFVGVGGGVVSGV